MRNVLPVIACALLVLASASPARAEQGEQPETPRVSAGTDVSDEAKREAARRFERAIKLYEEADYALALAEFERVHELVPDYRVLYNIGQVSIQLGRYARALLTLQDYLKRGGSALPSERVQAVQADLDLLAGRTAQLTVLADPPGAEILLDGVVVGLSPLPGPLVVDVGERRVRVRLAGYQPLDRGFTLAGGDRREGHFVLQAEQAARPAPLSVAPVSARKPSAQPSEHSRPWLWVGWTSAGALAAGAVASGILGISAASDLDEQRASPGAKRSDLDATRGRAKTAFLAADLLGAAALVTGGATLYFQLSGPKTNPHGARPAPRLDLALAAGHLKLTLAHD